MDAPLLLADTPWLLYRSYFALPKSIVDGEGRPVNALLGTVNALLGVIDGRLPARPFRGVVACLGAEDADYRVKLYPGYHAERDPMPRELAEQWGKAPDLLKGFGWTVSASAELEADDVMFSLAGTEEEAGGSALLLTGDRDLYGAVSERVAVIDLRKGGPEEVTPATVRERYGVEPEQVADFIALRGDPSDGLPGAPGIGAKTAAELLRRYGTLEAILLAADTSGSSSTRAQAPPDRPADSGPLMRPRTAASLRENADLVRKFRQIATLRRIDVERPPNRATDFKGGARAARELGMVRLAERLERRSDQPDD